MDDNFVTHLQELRRGTVVLAALHLLRTPGYGYGLLQELGSRGFSTDANTLYPLLRRLQGQGYLTSEWNTDESRPRKLYRTSDEGLRLAEALDTEWTALTDSVLDLPDSPPRTAGTEPAPAPAPAPRTTHAADPHTRD